MIRRNLLLFFAKCESHHHLKKNDVKLKKKFDLSHYHRLKTKISSLAEDERSNFIHENRYLYLYFTTNTFISGLRQGVEDNCYIMSEDETKSFSEIAYDLYSEAKSK
jgi:hypothetical protein